MSLLFPMLIVGFFVGIILLSWVRVLNEYERGVKFTLGRLNSTPVGPGLVVLFAPPLIDRIQVIDLRTVTMDVPPQDVITKDNISIKVNAVVFYRVVNPVKAVMEIEDYNYSTSQMAQTTLRSTVGQVELDELLSNRETISHKIQAILDEQTEPWGIKVTNVEIKYIDLPPDMQRAMAKQAEAERERRAKIINAEGEYQAAEKLVAAADAMAAHPMALQMRYLQTMVEIGAEHNTTIFFPVPVDIISSFIPKNKQ